MNYQWENNKIAIHFPEVSDDTPENIEDKTSLNENDYENLGAKRALPVFKDMNNYGG